MRSSQHAIGDEPVGTFGQARYHNRAALIDDLIEQTIDAPRRVGHLEGAVSGDADHQIISVQASAARR
jgi:hypothetical protein